MSSYSKLLNLQQATEASLTTTEAALTKARAEIARLQQANSELWAMMDMRAQYIDFACQLWQTLKVIGIEVAPPWPIRRDQLMCGDELSPRERAIELHELLKPTIKPVKVKRKIA